MRLMVFSYARQLATSGITSRCAANTSACFESWKTVGPTPKPQTNVSTPVPATASMVAVASLMLIGGSYT